jgi:predicted transcriptional regulator
LEAKLARIANKRGCDAEAVVRDAIERGFNYDEWFIREVDKGPAQIEHGDVLTPEAVGSSLEERCQGTVVAITGTMRGLAIALLATRSLEASHYGLTASDPVTMALACSVLIVTILTACYLPARRGSLIYPARTLAQS